MKTYTSCLIGVQILFFSLNAQAAIKGFSERDIANAFQTHLQIKLIKNDIFPDHLSLSPDGSVMTFIKFTQDIKNNHLYLMNSDGSNMIRVDTPYGFKGFPHINKGYLYFNYTPKNKRKAKGYKKGRYRLALDQLTQKPQFLYSHFLPYTKFNQPEVFRPVKNKKGIGIEFLYSDGRLNNVIFLKTKLAKNVRGIALDRDKRFFYVSAFDMSSGYPPKFNLYRFSNQSGAKGEVLVRDVLNPSPGLDYFTKDRLLFSKVSAGNIEEYDLSKDSTRTLIKCINGFFCRVPVFNPAKEIFYFVAQSESEKFGFFQAKWESK